MMFFKAALAGILVVSLAACAGRDAHPVAVSQPQDNAASCAAIQAEMDANSARISDLSSEKGWKAAQNVAAGVGGFFTLGILWAGMDFKNAAGTELEALEARNHYLGNLSVEKCRQQQVMTPIS